MRKIVKNGKVFIEDQYFDRLEGTGAEIVELLKSWSDEHGVGLSDFTIVSDYDYTYVQYWRDVTPEEKEAERVAKEKRAARSKKLKESKEASERAELARLQKKYGSTE